MKLYVSNDLTNSISIIDCDTLTLEREIYLGDDICTHHFCIEKDKDIIYLPSASDGVLYVLDIKTEKILDSISIGGNLSQIYICNDELFIVNEDSNSIYIVNKNELEPIGIISLDNIPHGFDLDVKNNKLYVPCLNSIVCIDIESKNIDKKIFTKLKAWHIRVDKQKEYIYTSTLDGKLLVLDKNTLNIKHSIEKFLMPIETCINYNKNIIYVADLGERNIKILDYNNYEMIGYIDIDGTPQGLEISNDGKYLFVTDTFNNSVKIYNTDDNELIKAIKVGKEPTTIIFV